MWYFSVSSIKAILSSFNRVRRDRIFVWNNWVPKKVGIVAWRAINEKLPTRTALALRRVNVPDLSCLFCGEYAESCEHIFVTCHFAQMVWQNIAIWCKMPPILAFDFKDLLELHGFSSGLRKRKKATHALVLIVGWCIWKTRNETMYNNGILNVLKVLEEVKSLGFLWVKNRSKEAFLTWEDWSRFSCFA
ncbi:uncharacterized protein LOC110880495 [Helianthus annuus]|uniref:uncharacterized protein LOC110880495 n=1 Tax=Helianthus annuus TaxID=4232 RepID=UPI000B905257|nr:uncharacterized protein LOC110880495 [Helianthus annuus]